MLADLSAGSLEGISMLQARPPGAVAAKRSGAPRFEVEYRFSAGGKSQLRAKMAEGEAVNATTTAALRSSREELQAVAKRLVTALENSRAVRVVSAHFEFAGEKEGLLQPGK